MKYNTESFINAVADINNCVMVVGEYVNSKTRIHCACKTCGYEWDAFPSNLLKGRGCTKCGMVLTGNKLRKTNKDFNIDVLNLNLPLVPVSEYLGASIKMEFKCKSCENIFYSTPTHILSGKGCPFCRGDKISKSQRFTQDEFEQKLYSVNGTIEVIGEYKNARENISVRCRTCGHEWSPSAYSLLAGCGCPSCARRASRGERIIENCLVDKDIKFISHKSFDGLRGVGGLPLSYDFYIPEKNMLIEMQGVQHERPVDAFGGVDSFETQLEHDARKRRYAEENGYVLVEIWYYEINRIENIIDSLFDPVTTIAS